MHLTCGAAPVSRRGTTTRKTSRRTGPSSPNPPCIPPALVPHSALQHSAACAALRAAFPARSLGYFAPVTRFLPAPALDQRNGEWRYLEFLQVTSLITADIFMCEIPGGTRARHRSRPVDLPEHRY